MNTKFFSKLLKNFELKPPALLKISQDFQSELQQAKAGKKSSLKYLPSFLKSPSGQEQGVFISLDFGGSLVRAQRIELSGGGQYSILEQKSQALKTAAHDYTKASADDLFDFIAQLTAGIVPDEKVYHLGHTFSYPAKQHSLNEAYLIGWTKELKVEGILGQNINDLLAAALRRNALPQVKPVAILNDTVATLLGKAYSATHTIIGSICGTGHNSCYFSDWAGEKMAVNLESGNFDKLPQTVYDRRLDAESEVSGQQILEKMVGGKYIGEIFRLALLDAYQMTGQGKIAEFWQTPYLFKAEDLSRLLSDSSADLSMTADYFSARHAPCDLAWRNFYQALAQSIIQRSAGLVAATYAALVTVIDPAPASPHVIAVDGALYKNLPGYASALQEYLNQLLKTEAAAVKIEPAQNASGVGAAIAAALTMQ